MPNQHLAITFTRCFMFSEMRRTALSIQVVQVSTLSLRWLLLEYENTYISEFVRRITSSSYLIWYVLSGDELSISDSS